MVNKERKVSATRFWRFIFPFIVLVVLLSSLFFVLSMDDTLLLGNTATALTKTAAVVVNTVAPNIRPTLIVNSP
uniref:Uncharacterized protein n=1 Tax=viral metagenome TaxID=1070528 RepID=A0A6C0IB10_9ZZZZ